MIQHALFSFDLDTRWRRLPGSDPDSVSIRDDDRDITMTLSAHTAHIDADNIEAFTRGLIESRLRQEHAMGSALGHATTIYETVVIAYPWGRAIAYYGHDDTGRRFSFSGTITAHGAISLSMITCSLSESELLAAMDEANQRIRFERTALTLQP